MFEGLKFDGFQGFPFLNIAELGFILCFLIAGLYLCVRLAGTKFTGKKRE
jgi:hypothetical protein